MIKNNMKYTAIRIIAVVFLANVILITLYCNYFLNKSISSGINKSKKERNMFYYADIGPGNGMGGAFPG